MTRTPELLRVIEQNELDKTSRCVRLVDSNGVFAFAVDEKYGGLVAAAPAMLKALEWYGWKVEESRKNTLEGDRARYDLDRDGGSRAYAAIKKVREFHR